MGDIVEPADGSGNHASFVLERLHVDEGSHSRAVRALDDDRTVADPNAAAQRFRHRTLRVWQRTPVEVICAMRAAEPLSGVADTGRASPQCRGMLVVLNDPTLRVADADTDRPRDRGCDGRRRHALIARPATGCTFRLCLAAHQQYPVWRSCREQTQMPSNRACREQREGRGPCCLSIRALRGSGLRAAASRLSEMMDPHRLSEPLSDARMTGTSQRISSDQWKLLLRFCTCNQ
jgi:hypothetical protein